MTIEEISKQLTLLFNEQEKRTKQELEQLTTQLKELTGKYNNLAKAYNAAKKGYDDLTLINQQLKKECNEVKEELKALKNNIVLSKDMINRNGRPRLDLTDEEIEWIKTQHESGLSLRKIAEQVNISHTKVSQILKLIQDDSTRKLQASREQADLL